MLPKLVPFIIIATLLAAGCGVENSSTNLSFGENSTETETETVTETETITETENSTSTIEVTFDSQGGSEASPPLKQVHSGDTYGTLALTTRTGYTFDGWWTSENGTGALITSTSIITATEDHTLYANWTLDSYNITYHNLENATTAIPNPSSYTFETSTITLTDAQKTGCTFDGWYTDTNFIHSISQIAQGSAGNLDLYAKWTLDTFTITYHNLEHATNSPSNPASYRETDSTITLAQAQKPGSTFNGWYTDSSFTHSISQIVQGTTGNLNLYAKFTDLAAPGKVTITSLIKTNSSITLIWDEPLDPDLDHVKVQCTNGYESAGAPQFITINSLAASTTYTISVTAVDWSGKESAPCTLQLTTESSSQPVAYTIISKYEQLTSLNLSENYVLTTDIDLSDKGNWTPIGSDSTPFTGKFEGAGHTISNLNMNGSYGFYAGIFIAINSQAVIQNLKITDATINITSDAKYTGGLIGRNGGTITNSSFTGNVSVYYDGLPYAGGLVGENGYDDGTTYPGTISNSYASCTITVTGNSSATGVGGLVGVHGYGSITDSYATGQASGNSNYVGGLVGQKSYGTITNSYAAVIVSGPSARGFIGWAYQTSGLSNCYYNYALAGGGIESSTSYGINDINLTVQGNFVGFDFDNIWAIDPAINSGYPYLRGIEP